MPDSLNVILPYRPTWQRLSFVKSMQTKIRQWQSWFKIAPVSLCIFYNNAPGTVPIYVGLCILGPNAFDDWFGP